MRMSFPELAIIGLTAMLLALPCRAQGMKWQHQHSQIPEAPKISTDLNDLSDLRKPYAPRWRVTDIGYYNVFTGAYECEFLKKWSLGYPAWDGAAQAADEIAGYYREFIDGQPWEDEFLSWQSDDGHTYFHAVMAFSPNNAHYFINGKNPEHVRKLFEQKSGMGERPIYTRAALGVLDLLPQIYSPKEISEMLSEKSDRGEAHGYWLLYGLGGSIYPSNSSSARSSSARSVRHPGGWVTLTPRKGDRKPKLNALGMMKEHLPGFLKVLIECENLDWRDVLDEKTVNQAIKGFPNSVKGEIAGLIKDNSGPATKGIGVFRTVYGFERFGLQQGKADAGLFDGTRLIGRAIDIILEEEKNKPQAMVYAQLGLPFVIGSRGWHSWLHR